MGYPSDEWLRAALRYSLKATSSYSKNDRTNGVTTSSSESDSLRNDPRFLAIIEGIIFSRKFIVSYQVVLVIIILLAAVTHWVGKIQRAQRRRNAKTRIWSQHLGLAKNTSDTVKIEGPERGGSTSSSSSSTLKGVATPPQAVHTKNGDERSPLLAKSRSTAFQSPKFISRVRAFLLYQPRQIPYVNKSLPSNGTTIFILLFVALNIFYTFYRQPLTKSIILILGDRAGLVFVANTPWLYLLSAKNTPLKHLTGYSYEALNIFHRRLGELLCLEALIHTICMFVAFLGLQSAQFTFIDFLTSRIVILGILAFVSYETLYFTSLSSFRQRWYETFLILHVLLQFAALFFLFFHHHGARPYVAIALGIFLVDRIVFRLLAKSRTVRADLNIAHDKETVLVSANWQPPKSIWARLTGLGGVRYGWLTAQHVFISVPVLSRRHVVQAHPFTIVSAAPGRGDNDERIPHAWFNLIIRAHDGFTRDLLDYAKSHLTAKVRIDGPYGSISALEMLRDSDIALLVAGGSGIAVAYPLLWSLLMETDSDEDIEDPDDRMHQRPRKVCLIWVVHQASHLSWIGDEGLRELDEQGLDIVVPEPTADAGRPNVRALVRNAVERHSNALMSAGALEEKLKTGVVCSGPDEMNRAVRNECAALVKESMDVEIEVEKFGW